MVVPKFTDFSKDLKSLKICLNGEASKALTTCKHVKSYILFRGYMTI